MQKWWEKAWEKRYKEFIPLQKTSIKSSSGITTRRLTMKTQ
jgi:hypothetical protein